MIGLWPDHMRSGRGMRNVAQRNATPRRRRLTRAAARSHLACTGFGRTGFGLQSMIRKSGNRFSEKIMLNQRDEIMMRLFLIAP